MIDDKKLFATFRWAGTDGASGYRVVNEADKVGITHLAAPRSMADWQKSATKAATFALQASQVANEKSLVKGDLALAAAMLLLGTLGQIYHDCGHSRQQVLSVLDLIQTLSSRDVSFAPDSSKITASNRNVNVSFVGLDDVPEEVRAVLTKLGIRLPGPPPATGGGNGVMN